MKLHMEALEKASLHGLMCTDRKDLVLGDGCIFHGILLFYLILVKKKKKIVGV